MALLLLVPDRFTHNFRLVDMNSRVFVDGYYQYIINTYSIDI